MSEEQDRKGRRLVARARQIESMRSSIEQSKEAIIRALDLACWLEQPEAFEWRDQLVAIRAHIEHLDIALAKYLTALDLGTADLGYLEKER